MTRIICGIDSAVPSGLTGPMSSNPGVKTLGYCHVLPPGDNSGARARQSGNHTQEPQENGICKSPHPAFGHPLPIGWGEGRVRGSLLGSRVQCAKRLRRIPTPLLIFFCCLCGAFDMSAASKKVMVLGIDGMDPKLLQTFVDQG